MDLKGPSLAFSKGFALSQRYFTLSTLSGSVLSGDGSLNNNAFKREMMATNISFVQHLGLNIYDISFDEAQLKPIIGFGVMNSKIKDKYTSNADSTNKWSQMSWLAEVGLLLINPANQLFSSFKISYQDLLSSSGQQSDSTPEALKLADQQSVSALQFSLGFGVAF